MKYSAATILAATIIGASSPPARAQTLRLFFDSAGLSNPADDASPIAGSPALGNPQVSSSGTQRLYLWGAPSDESHTWLGISLDIQTTGDAQILNSRMLNPAFPGPFQHWLAVNQGSIDTDGQNLTGIRLFAVPVDLPDEPVGLVGTDHAAGDLHHDPATNSTLLGWIELSGEGEVFLAIGSKGIARAGSLQPVGDRINLGFGDESDNLRGGDYGQSSTEPDATLATICPADFDNDGFVTGLDFDAFVTAFEAGDPSADFDNDGFITGLDFDAFVTAFEAGCD